MAKRESRLARLEDGADNHETGPHWWGMRKWLGHSLTPDQEAAVAALEASEEPYDLHAPVDTRGWSDEARRWLGFDGPARADHRRSG